MATTKVGVKIGVIGGSGVYDIDGLEAAEWVSVETPWGKPSDAILTGHLDGVDIAFLPRHGRGHVHSPTSVPYRANIDALKRLGVTDVVSLSACGSFREEMAPGDFVIVDQFIDRTIARGGVFQLWGHSWELEDHQQWEHLDRVLALLAEHAAAGRVQLMTNGELAALSPTPAPA